MSFQEKVKSLNHKIKEIIINDIKGSNIILILKENILIILTLIFLIFIFYIITYKLNEWIIIIINSTDLVNNYKVKYFIDKDIITSGLGLKIFIGVLLFFKYFNTLRKVFKTLINTERFDIIFTYIIIVIYSIYLLFNISTNFTIFSIICFAFILIGIKIYLLKNNNKRVPILISDKNEKDELGFEHKAKQLGEIILNNNSEDNHVFGIIAEWGTGKTTFLNYLEDEIKDDVIYIEFDTWYYNDRSDLLSKFLENILVKLDEKFLYSNNLRKITKQLINIFENNSNFLFGNKVSLNFNDTKSLESIKAEIKNCFKEYNKKIVIVIDDLDRVGSKTLKEIFSIIDLCKDFHNTTFLLCYDPINFNSIDDNLKELTTYEEGKQKHITKEIVDNRELTRYISKIVTINYPLSIEINKLKSYFGTLFTNNDKIKFSSASKQNIETGIEKLFTQKEYKIWGKYYSNIRLLKRIVNIFIIITHFQKNPESGEGSIIFNGYENLTFDTLFKFVIILTYHKNIFDLMYKESSIAKLNNDFLKDDYIFIYTKFGDKSINQNFNDYCNSLIDDEKNMVLNLFNTNEKTLFQYNNLLNYCTITLGNNTDIWELLIKFDDINKKLGNIINKQGNIKDILEEIYNQYSIEGLDILFDYFKKEVLNKNIVGKTVTFKFIDEWINFKQFYKINKFDFTFYLDITSVLNNYGITYGSDYLENITDYFYGGDSKESIFQKIYNVGEEIGTQESKIFALREILRLLFIFDESRGGSFYSFWDAFKKENEDLNKYKTKILQFVKTKYIENNYNIFKEIFNFENNNNNNNYKPEKGSLISHITYMMTHYSDEEYKKIFSDYFIKIFMKDDEIFIKFLKNYIDEGFNSDGKYDFTIKEFLDQFIFEDLKEFLDSNKDNLKELAQKDKTTLKIKSKYSGFGFIETSYNELLSEFFNKYDFIANKK